MKEEVDLSRVPSKNRAGINGWLWQESELVYEEEPLNSQSCAKGGEFSESQSRKLSLIDSI